MIGVTLSSLRYRLFSLVHYGAESNRIDRVFQISIMVLIGLNVLAIVLETFSLPIILNQLLFYFEVGSVAIFSLEIIARVYTADLLYEPPPASSS